MRGSSSIALYIDPPTHHFLRDQLFNIDNVSLNGDQLLAPYVHLRNYFTSRGIAIHTADYLSKNAGGVNNVYVSIGNPINYRKLTDRQDIMLSAFFAMECPVVEPSLYRALSTVQRHFKRIFSWSDSKSLEPFVGKPLRCEAFRWPQSFENVHEEIWNNRNRKFLVMINANKLPALYWQELYTERLRAVEFFSRTEEIDLYGVGWGEPPYRMGKTWMPYTFRRMHRALLGRWQHFHPDPYLEAARRVYRGHAKSKAQTLGNYTFAVCFENSILKGWMTEKIFDCFFAGTIPIYWGAPDIEEHVPQDCFIDMRRFSEYRELREYLKSLNKHDISNYRQSAREYLRSPQFRPFTKDAFVELFSRIVSEDTGVQLS